MNEQQNQMLANFRVEVPSWGFSRSGTRFHAFAIPGEARTLSERIADAGLVQQLTGAVSAVALHIPWDETSDYQALKEQVEETGLQVGAINPNLFQEELYRFGSLASSDPAARELAVSHCLECVEIMRLTESKGLSIWLPDGSNYPGQMDFAAAFGRMVESLQAIYEGMDEDQTMLIEYKFFEPAFYHTVLSDWGTAVLAAQEVGPNAKILVDLGHHPMGTNIEAIVALVSKFGRLGGFHFNARKYADDDLTTGSLNPYELFLIFVELNKFYDLSQQPGEICLVLDQSHNVKCKVEATIQSVTNLQLMYAKSLLVDYDKLQAAQEAQDVVACEEILKGAFDTDTRPWLQEIKRQQGLPEEPLQYFRTSGLKERRIEARR